MKVYEITPKYHLVRRGNEEPMDRPEQIVRYMEGAFDNEPTVESVWVIALNSKFRPIGRVKVGSGILNSCLIHPREVFRAAIMASACSIVLVHNLCAAAHRLCYVTSRAMWSACGPFTRGSLCA
jgi:DNA repair protein RadC